jgi:hypothetical protein
MASLIWATAFSAWTARASALRTWCSASASLFSAPTSPAMHDRDAAWRSRRRASDCPVVPRTAEIFLPRNSKVFHYHRKKGFRSPAFSPAASDTLSD